MSGRDQRVVGNLVGADAAVGSLSVHITIIKLMNSYLFLSILVDTIKKINFYYYLSILIIFSHLTLRNVLKNYYLIFFHFTGDKKFFLLFNL